MTTIGGPALNPPFYTYKVIKKILTFGFPYRSAPASLYDAETMKRSDYEYQSGRVVSMSISTKNFVDTNPKAANDHAKDIVFEYECDKPNNELVGGEFGDRTLCVGGMADEIMAILGSGRYGAQMAL
ncbi:MAG: hypothetical protein Q9174_002820 [Haloplaca sp. 1 TL-2023]